MKPAWDHPQFRAIRLDETYVFDFALHPGSVVFTVDFVLATSHPLYADPAPGEAFDYRPGTITFTDVLVCRWESSGGRMTVDPDGSRDWDTFESVEWNDFDWMLRGEFGVVSLTARTVEVEFHPGGRLLGR